MAKRKERRKEKDLSTGKRRKKTGVKRGNGSEKRD